MMYRLLQFESVENDLESSGLLADDEPPPFEVVKGGPRSSYVIACDHASPTLPLALGSLGLSPGDLDCHIAWDICSAALVRCLRVSLDVWLILLNFECLVFDLNWSVLGLVLI